MTKNIETKPATAHTPGPWLISARQPAPLPIEICEPGSGLIVAQIPFKLRDGKQICYNEDQTQAQAEANATFIAAAPDLLAACEAAQGWLMFLATYHTDAFEKLQQLNAAIAKARGQTPRSDGCTCPADGSGAVKPCPVHPGVCL